MENDLQIQVLQRWEALEKRWLELCPETPPAENKEFSNLEKTIKRGLAVPKVYELRDGAWEVDFAGIKVLHKGFEAEGKARRFAKQLLSDGAFDDQNLEAARQFVNSCENWKDYDTNESLSKFVDALMLIRPLTVDKIWAVFRSMINNGEIKPAR